MNNNEEVKLAIFNGSPAISKTFERYNTIGNEEIKAVNNVLQSGVLSKFLGCWDEDFYGGPMIQKLERTWEEHFETKNAVSVNSNTSGLIVALGAVGIEPGDEVIVSTWSMSASATAILIWNAIPIFADIEDKTFNLDPNKIAEKITPRTKAIVVPDIFGHAAELNSIMYIAKKHNLKVIEDAAQSPGAYYHGKAVGTVADIGVFSLNYHKHIHSGEGGVCVTNDDELAERMQLIRNHGESVVKDKGTTNLSNMIGFNFRMTEIEASIACEQLKKLDALVAKKQEQATLLSEGISNLDGLRTPIIKENCTHAFYILPLLLDVKGLKIPRSIITEALVAEGLSGLGSGYVNIHRLPMYQNKIAYGAKGFPWTKDICQGTVNYENGICPVAETCHDKTFMGLEICLYDYTRDDINSIIRCFDKVWSHLNELRAYYHEKHAVKESC